MSELLEQAKQMQNDLVTWRRQLHQNPETGMDLPQTSAFVKSKLEEMGYKPNYVAKTGVTALAGGKKAGKCFLLRADMDALPITEETDLTFKSKNGKMHACGHDLHTAMLLGAAKLLKENEDRIKGSVKLMFQPGEEILKGAKAMIEDGILENPAVDAAAMIHVGAGLPKVPSGLIIVSGGGPCSMASDSFEIHIKGKGGHGAMPETAVDPLNAAAHIYISLQAIHARELASGSNSVITIGMMSGGNANNVIPDTAVLKGTIRTLDEKVRRFIFSRIREIAESTAKTFRAEAKVDIFEGCPSLVVDGNAANDIRAGLKEIFGNAVPDPDTLKGGTMNGSEDFSFISNKVPSVMMAITAGSTDEGYLYPMHHPKATFDEAVLWKGAAAYAATAIEWLKRNC